MTHHLHVVYTVSAIFTITAGYNISPVPNLIFSEPDGRRNFPKVRSSYFGLALHLKKDRIFVGAPRAQSSSLKLAGINETGAIYRCNIISGLCEQDLDVDSGGYEYDIIKTGQYFGATLDGLADGEEVVGCAPRMIVGNDQQHSMTGSCYTRVNGTTRNQRQALNAILNTGNSLYDTALEGFAVHLLRGTNDGLEIVTGLPYFGYSGSVIMYTGVLQSGALLNGGNYVPQGSFGYSVSSMMVQNRTIYVVSAPRFTDKIKDGSGAPRFESASGKVFLFEKVLLSEKKADMKIHRILYGDDIGDYFGYALCTEDINGDGLVDVVVGAPFQSKDLISDNGAVYVYISKGIDSNGMLMLEKQVKLESNYTGSGQFGYSIATVGDINHDGFNDIAIGAPFEQDGAVYIFHGSSTGILPAPSQILKKLEGSQGLSMFGASITKGVDLDHNDYNDIAIGAPRDDKVYLFKTYPLVLPKVEMTTSKNFISISDVMSHLGSVDIIEDECVLTVCYHYVPLATNLESYSYDFTINLTLDPILRRAKFENTSMYSTMVKLSTEETCLSLNFSVQASFYQLSSPIKLELQFDIVNQNTSSDVFCEECAFQSRGSQSRIERKIHFKPDCEKELCATELKLKETFRSVVSPLVLNSTRTMEFQYQIKNFGEAAYGTILNITFSQNTTFLKKTDFCEETSGSLSCKINNGRALRQGMTAFVNLTMDVTTLEEGHLEIQAQLYSDGNETVNEDNTVTTVIELTRLSIVDVVGTFDPSFLNTDMQKENVTVRTWFDMLNFGPSNVEPSMVSLYIPVEYELKSSSLPLVNLKEDLKVVYKGSVIQTIESPSIRALEVNQPKMFIETIESNDQFLIKKKGTTISCYDPSVICRNVTFFLDMLPVNDEPVSIELELHVFPQSMTKLMNDDIEKVSLYITFDLNTPHKKLMLSTTGSLMFYRTIPVIPLWVYVIAAIIGLALLSTITYVLHKRQFFKRMTQSDMEDKLTKTEGVTNVSFLDGSVMMIDG